VKAVGLQVASHLNSYAWSNGLAGQAGHRGPNVRRGALNYGRMMSMLESRKSDSEIGYRECEMVGRLLAMGALVALVALSASCAPSPGQLQEAIGATQTLEAVIQRGIQETAQASLPSPTIPPSPLPPSTSTLRPRPTSTPEGMMDLYGETCYRWDTVSLDDVGRTLCAWGESVKQRVDEDNGVTWLYFGEDRLDFQFVLYAEEGYYESWEPGQLDCIYLSGPVHRIGQTPVITIQGNVVNTCD